MNAFHLTLSQIHTQKPLFLARIETYYVVIRFNSNAALKHSFSVSSYILLIVATPVTYAELGSRISGKWVHVLYVVTDDEETYTLQQPVAAAAVAGFHLVENTHTHRMNLCEK